MKTKFELDDEIVLSSGGIRRIHRIEIFSNCNGGTVNYHDIDGYNIGSDEYIDSDYVKRIEENLSRTREVLNRMKNKLAIEELREEILGRLENHSEVEGMKNYLVGNGLILSIDKRRKQ